MNEGSDREVIESVRIAAVEPSHAKLVLHGRGYMAG